MAVFWILLLRLFFAFLRLKVPRSEFFKPPLYLCVLAPLREILFYPRNHETHEIKEAD
jgi:hypothetical protein